MASRDPRVTDAAAFDRLRLDLIDAGFEPVGDGTARWEGPIFECFRPLAPDADRMEILIKDGFPHVFPKIFVEGMPGEHVAANGDVCLWTGTDETYTWRRLDDIEKRAGEWVERQSHGFEGPDAVLDAHLYFELYSPSKIAVFELDSVARDREATVEVSGSWNEAENVLGIAAGHKGEVQGRCYSISRPPAPPRTLDEFRAALSRGQQANLDRRLKRVAERGEDAILMITWGAEQDRNVLVLSLTRGAEGSVNAIALEAAPTDRRFELLRAGPDTDALDSKKAVVFGIGAVGSHAALILGSSGFGDLRLVDGGTIRPADKARHASGGIFEGRSKARAVEILLAKKSPWTEAASIEESPWDPARVHELIEGYDIVVELTGYGRFTDLISLAATEAEVPLVSGALYRRGGIGRVRCQTADQLPISERIDLDRYPLIPPEDEAPPALEPGCGEPVNNASPIRVQRLAGLVADVVIDVALCRDVPEEIVEVYDPIETAPFDNRGRLELPE